MDADRACPIYLAVRSARYPVFVNIAASWSACQKIQVASKWRSRRVFSQLHAGGPDELFAGKEAVVDSLFTTLVVVHCGLSSIVSR